jgi:hypothetical protein
MSSRTRLAAAALIAAGATALVGCGTHPPQLSGHEINVARRFTVYDIYWVGRRFQGIPLVAADFRREYNPQLGLAVYYGDCARKVSLFGAGGCHLPLQITSVCYVQHHNDGLGPRRSARIRGVPAVIFNGGKSIELYTGNILVDVYADRPSRALAAAKRLFPLNGPPQQRHLTAQLPAPRYTPGLIHPWPPRHLPPALRRKARCPR